MHLMKCPEQTNPENRKKMNGCQELGKGVNKE
jgi:hypothetical protein